jgi:beclin 1
MTVSECQEVIEHTSSLRTQSKHMEAHLHDMQSCYLLNRAFFIWFDGHFGLINGFRLGRLPSQPVEWMEVNAAWGDVCLLLVTMAKKAGFSFSQWLPIAAGSQSRIESVTDKKSFEMYGSNEISFNILFWKGRYDSAMVAFLCCVKQLADFFQRQCPEFAVPHKIDKETIGDINIKYSAGEATWTRALKFLLTDLKFMIMYLAANAPDGVAVTAETAAAGAAASAAAASAKPSVSASSAGSTIKH